MISVNLEMGGDKQNLLLKTSLHHLTTSLDSRDSISSHYNIHALFPFCGYHGGHILEIGYIMGGRLAGIPSPVSVCDVNEK